MPSRLIEAETMTCFAECHKAHGVTVSLGQNNGNRLRASGLRNAMMGIINRGARTPQPPTVPQPMRPKTSSSMVMAGHELGAWPQRQEKLAKNDRKIVSSLQHGSSCRQQLMWPLSKRSHAPRLVPLPALIFPRIARRCKSLFIVLLLLRASVAGFPLIM